MRVPALPAPSAAPRKSGPGRSCRPLQPCRMRSRSALLRAPGPVPAPGRSRSRPRMSIASPRSSVGFVVVGVAWRLPRLYRYSRRPLVERQFLRQQQTKDHGQHSLTEKDESFAPSVNASKTDGSPARSRPTSPVSRRRSATAMPTRWKPSTVLWSRRSTRPFRVARFTVETVPARSRARRAPLAPLEA